MKKTDATFPSAKPELKMTALIDVIFLLLIFFVCTANFQRLEELLPTNMSLAGQGQVQPSRQIPQKVDVATIKISFDRAPVWQIEGNTCRSLDHVRTILTNIQRQKDDLPVIIDPDSGVPMSTVIDTYDICRLAKLRKIQFAASKDSLRPD